jgi:hypothetical protein
MIAIQNVRTIVTNFPELVERRAADLPDDMMRCARHAYIPSRDELMLAGYYEGRYRPRGWQLKETTVFKKFSGSHVLWVRGTRIRQPLWALERVGVRTDDDQMLCYAFGPMPILTRSYQAAMWLAEYCHLDTPDNLGLMHWIDADA